MVIHRFGFRPTIIFSPFFLFIDLCACISYKNETSHDKIFEAETFPTVELPKNWNALERHYKGKVLTVQTQVLYLVLLYSTTRLENIISSDKKKKKKKALPWFRYYTTDFYQVDGINGDSSEPRKVHTGVLQGSVLGPLSFKWILFVQNSKNALWCPTRFAFKPDIIIFFFSSLFAYTDMTKCSEQKHIPTSKHYVTLSSISFYSTIASLSAAVVDFQPAQDPEIRCFNLSQEE